MFYICIAYSYFGAVSMAEDRLSRSGRPEKGTFDVEMGELFADRSRDDGADSGEGAEGPTGASGLFKGVADKPKGS